MTELKNTTETPMTADPLLAPVLFKNEFLDWLDEYFERVDKVFEYQSKSSKKYKTKEQLYKDFERGMLESPFK